MQVEHNGFAENFSCFFFNIATRCVRFLKQLCSVILCVMQQMKLSSICETHYYVYSGVKYLLLVIGSVPPNTA